jgi:hypothetical protein
MKITVNDVKLISGDTDNDKLVAGQFCRAALAEVKQRADLIDAICALDEILDASVLSKARDAYAGICHITAAVDGVAEFHRNGNLGQLFNKLISDILFIAKKAEANYKWLQKLFT